MAHDYFALLGLSPGRYAPAEIARCYRARRARLLAELHAAGRQHDTLQQLDELHVAYSTLRDARRQAEYRRARTDGEDRVTEVRRLISVSLEDGLLRYSRRQAILERARALGFSDFQTHLLIAQVQFGDEDITTSPRRKDARGWGEHPRAWARIAAVGVIALAMFLGLVHWVGA